MQLSEIFTAERYGLYNWGSVIILFWNVLKKKDLRKAQTKSLAVKGVPVDITDSEFQEFLDLNKINYAKAERLKSKKTVGCYQFFN